MSEHYTGGCACGAVRYQISATPVFANHCQCRDCQRRSGTGHGSYLTFAERAGVALSGEAKEWRLKGDSGNEKIHAFCPHCGTPVYLTFAAMPSLFTIHAASLDDPQLYDPKVLTYAASGFVWDKMDAALPAFAKMPG
jgi:hypothetical protein